MNCWILFNKNHRQAAPHRHASRSVSLAATSLIGLLLLAMLEVVSASGNPLPTLGDTTSGIVSTREERILGDAFLRDLNRSVNTTDDIQIQDYTERLLFRLSTFSELQDRDFRLLVIDDATINAFAAPGSVVGVNLGLFLAAESESEFAAVMAHELAHLSQRHFARSKEKQSKQLPAILAGLLGSIALISGGSTEAGLAALQSTQAVAAAKQLSYSRALEKEADRIGVDLLHKSKLNPEGMVGIFTRMHQASRHNTHPPEFLLTHPVSERRISDARNQIARFDAKPYPLSLDYQLMRARARVKHLKPAAMISIYQKVIKNAEDKMMRSVGFYGVALGLMASQQFDEAQQYIDALMAQQPHKLSSQFLQSEFWIKTEQFDRTIAALEQLLQINTDNQVAAALLVTALRKEQQYEQAHAILKRQTSLHPDSVALWYQMAEVAGLTKDIVGVHKARATFYTLRGEWDKAIGHLESALLLVPKDSGGFYQLSSRLEALEQSSGRTDGG